MRANAPDEMVFLSQYPDKSLSWYQHNYVYDDSAGEDIDVYIVNRGADLDRPDFTGGNNLASRSRWIHAHETFDHAEDDSSLTVGTNFGDGHGNCMLSKVRGHIYGSAKRSIQSSFVFRGAEKLLMVGLKTSSMA